MGHFDVDRVRARQAKQEKSDVSRLVAPLPDSLKQAAVKRWEAKRHDRAQGLRGANMWLVEYMRGFENLPFGVDLVADDMELQSQARQRAQEMEFCGRRARFRGESAETSAASIINEAQAKYLASVKAQHMQGAVMRLTDSAFWLRNMRKAQARVIESEMIKSGAVSKMKSAYVSNEQLAKFRAAKKRNAALMAAITATNDKGQSFTLADLSARSVSNPVLRHAELMTRIAGMEEIAQNVGHCGVFLTITAPSEYHAQKQNAKGFCYANPTYSEKTPKETQAYLREVWARIRSALDRSGIYPYGVRVAEPHHDGTPHWHLIAFVPRNQRGAFVRICRKYVNQQDKNEAWAWKYRFNVKHIDFEKGSAAGYLIKYISKNIDGEGCNDLGDIESGLDAASGAERVLAWASTWSIRQFQFFGSAPVGVWRELRRLRGDVPDVFAAAAAAADCGDWAEFCLLMKLNEKTIYRVDAGLNQYQEAITKVKGLVDGLTGETVETRTIEWVIERRAVDFGAAFDLPRTCVNNCTRQKLADSKPEKSGEFKIYQNGSPIKIGGSHDYGQARHEKQNHFVAPTSGGIGKAGHFLH